MTETPTDPELQLALAYVPGAARPALDLLFRLDARLGSTVATTSEPAIGAIRLAWWRDALIRLDQAPAPAEPLLRALAETVIGRLSGAQLASLVEGWGVLLDDAPDAEALARYGRDRGGRLFMLAATLLGGGGDAGVAAAGAGWALVDLVHGTPDPGLAARARAAAQDAFAGWNGRTPPPLRPLGMLAVLARGDAAAEAPRRQGAPGRILRMIGYRIIGR